MKTLSSSIRLTSTEKISVKVKNGLNSFLNVQNIKPAALEDSGRNSYWSFYNLFSISYPD
jgi:hypothetical protein